MHQDFVVLMFLYNPLILISFLVYYSLGMTSKSAEIILPKTKGSSTAKNSKDTKINQFLSVKTR